MSFCTSVTSPAYTMLMMDKATIQGTAHRVAAGSSGSEKRMNP